MYGKNERHYPHMICTHLQWQAWYLCICTWVDESYIDTHYVKRHTTWLWSICWEPGQHEDHLKYFSCPSTTVYTNKWLVGYVLEGPRPFGANSQETVLPAYLQAHTHIPSPLLPLPSLPPSLPARHLYNAEGINMDSLSLLHASCVIRWKGGLMVEFINNLHFRAYNWSGVPRECIPPYCKYGKRQIFHALNIFLDGFDTRNNEVPLHRAQLTYRWKLRNLCALKIQCYTQQTKSSVADPCKVWSKAHTQHTSYGKYRTINTLHG